MNLRNFQTRVQEFKKRLDPNRIEREKCAAKRIGIVKGLAWGTLVGGIVGVLFAPDKGENTRKKAKDEIIKAKENLEVGLDQGKEKLVEMYENNKSRIPFCCQNSDVEENLEELNIVGDDALEKQEVN